MSYSYILHNSCNKRINARWLFLNVGSSVAWNIENSRENRIYATFKFPLNQPYTRFSTGWISIWSKTPLLAVTEDTREALGSNMITVLVLFDFSKAFDTIPHKKLLKKLLTLCKCSDRSLRWFFTYLHGRVRTVFDEGGSVSAWLKTLAGVPQRSVLALLFLIYINDLPIVLR